MPNAGGATASPAFYVVNGKEYVVYGFGGEPGNSPVLGDAVIAFALEGDDGGEAVTNAPSLTRPAEGLTQIQRLQRLKQ